MARNLGVMKEATTVKDVESSDPGCPAECSIHKKNVNRNIFLNECFQINTTHAAFDMRGL